MSEAPNVVPGQVMTEEQKKQMADFNAQATEEAHKMAADKRAQDENQRPVVLDVAESIKDKLAALPPEEGATEEVPAQ